MNLGELKTLVYKLLDESRPKTDLTEKIPVFVDAGQKEVSIYAPIWRQEQYEADGELPMDCRRPDRVVDERGTPLAWRVVQGMDTKTLAAERYPCILVYEAIPADVTDKTPDGKELEIGEQAGGGFVCGGPVQQPGVRSAVFPELLRAVSGQAGEPGGCAGRPDHDGGGRQRAA